MSEWKAPEVSFEEKDRVWKAYLAGEPVRVPVTLGTNSRVFVLNPELNTKGMTYEQVFNDPKVMFEASLETEYYVRTVIRKYSDQASGLPEKWQVCVSWQNVYEAVFFGAKLFFREGQVPDTEPFLAGDDKERIFDVDIEEPLKNPLIRKALEFYEAMCELADGYEFHGRPVEVARYAQTGSDGALTGAMSVRGSEILTDLVLDPDYAHRLFDYITQAQINRVYAFRKYWKDDSIGAGYADDSIQLISTEMYKEHVLPYHRRVYDEFYPEGKARGIHLCGDVQRHMVTIRDELGITSWDTGFPMDFARARRELGPDFTISGGVPVAMLLNATPQEVYDEACRILESGIMDGGKFVLREANNLPPCVPLQNLSAMYKASFDILPRSPAFCPS